MTFNKLAIALAVAGISTCAYATNGDNLIGLGAQSRALGGVSTAAFFGSENALSNPALLGKMQGTEFVLGATAFMPNVTASNNAASSSSKSKADMFAIPEVSLATRINDNWTFGLGMFGTSGMGVDYRDNPFLFRAYSNLQMMKFVPALAYNSGNFGFGIAPVVQYGSLDINYNMTPGPGNVGHGSSSDFGYGANLGAYLDVAQGLTLGVTYQSEISMNYDGVISTAATPMGLAFSDKLTQPAEAKVGVAYTTGPWLLSGDYKRVYWADADGYKSFNWKDQDVFALGVKYSGGGWWLGAGFNYAKDPIGVLPSPAGTAVNMFNNVFFPAIVKDHYTLGGGYSLNKNISLDLAYVHAAKVSKTIDITALGGTTETTSHSQDGVTASLRMNF